jgi:hypothetical protein
MESEAHSWAFLDRWLRRAEKAVGVVTILLSIAAFGFGLLFGDPLRAVTCALVTFGIVGSIEVVHLQARARLAERLVEREDHNELFSEIREAHADWKPLMIKEFEHCGFIFRAVGFEKLPLPITVTPPLCPKCKGSLVQRARVTFPGRTRIEFRCTCGFCQSSILTRPELIHEAEQLANTPK